MAKQYIPGVSGLLTEPNPADSPSNTLSEAENVIIEQGGKVQARHGFNVIEKEFNPSVVDTEIYASQYTNVLPFLKFVQYKDSSDNVKTLFFVKQTVQTYGSTQYGIYKIASDAVKNRFYIIDSEGNLGNYETLKYSNVKNVFSTKQSVFLQTENGIAEANVDDIDQTTLNDTLFDIKWPAFPEISFKLKKSSTVGNWLKAGYKCKMCITFYRETGYTDKEGMIYESQPSVPVIIESPTFDSIPEVYIDFRPEYESSLSYKVLNQFTQANRGRKFGIKVYRTEIKALDEEFGDEFFQCYQDIPFEKFMASPIYYYDSPVYDNADEKEYALRDSLSAYRTTSSDLNTVDTTTDYLPLELNVGDYVNVAYDGSQTSGNYRIFSADRALEGTAFSASKYKMVYPSRYFTTDSDLLKLDYRPVRLKVVSKSYKRMLYNNGTDIIFGYVYKFQTIDYVHNEYNYDPFLGWVAGTEVIPKNTVINPMSGLTQLWTTQGNYGDNTTKLLIARSYVVELTINDNGIIDQPQLYTNPNADGSINTNLIVPRSEKSISYHGIQTYHGVQSSLTTNVFLTKQPKYEQVSLNIKKYNNGSPSGNTYPYSASQFMLNNSTLKTFTANTSQGTLTLSSVSIDPIAAGITAGMYITGPNLIYGTQVAGVTTNSIILTSGFPALATATGATFFVQTDARFIPETTTLTFTATTTNGSNILTAVTPNPLTAGVAANMPISGANLLKGTTVDTTLASPVTATQISLNKNAFASGTITIYVTYTSNTSRKLFLDSPVFATDPVTNLNADLNGIPSKDVEIASFDGIDVFTRAPTFPIYVNFGSLFNESNLSTAITPFRIHATMYEQAKLTLRLTSTSDVVKTISIKTTPVYNRKGYYSKFNASGVYDSEFLRYDGTPNEANGIQLTNYKELAQRQAFRVTTPSPKLIVNSGGVTASTLTSLDATMASGIFNVPGDRDGQYPSNGNVRGFTTTQATTARGLFLDETNGKIVIRTDATLGFTTNTLDIKSFDAPGYVLIQYNQYNGSVVDGNQTITGWKNIRTIVCSYQTAVSPSNNVYEFTGIKTVMSNFDRLKTQTGIHPDVIFDLFFIKASSAETIELYPYGSAPNIRSAYIDLFATGTSPNYTYSASLDEYYYDNVINDFGVTATANTGTTSNSPNEPFFTFHPHKNRIQDPIAFLSPNYNNHKFLGEIKSQSTLWDEYVQTIIDGFNKQFRLQNIEASLRKGEGIGEFIIDYPDGKKIEMRNDYGTHEFYPNINQTRTLTNTTAPFNYTSDFITLATRTNKEYVEKNLLQWSRREIPEITTPSLYVYLGKTDKAIIGTAANTDDLYVFKEDGIWRCTDNGNTNASGNNDLPSISSYIFSTNIICQAAGSIQEINDEIIFLSQYGFMSISGGGMQNISNSIQRDILTLLQVSPKDRIVSYVNESKNIYCCTLINEKDTSLDVKSGTYVFNVKTRQWSFIDEEILTGLEDSEGKTIAAYRQRPVNAKFLGSVSTTNGTRPTYYFNDSVDSNNRVVRSTETTPLDMFYITREIHTNNIRYNALDQYDYFTLARFEGATYYYIQKSGSNEFFVRTETIPANSLYRNKFRTSVEYAKVASSTTVLSPGDNVSIVDSFTTLFANRTLYLYRNIAGIGVVLTQIRLKKTDVSNLEMLVYFEFVDTPPAWFTSMGNGYFNTGNPSGTYAIVAGVPTKITFNPESGNQPDTNKLFQEYMIHTETANKGALMSFKTDSQSSFTADRRFVYDSAATNRNVFRTYIPTKVARGRYLIRQVKHDLPLENLIITGQTIVMRDSGSTRVQKDKDDN